MKNNNKTSLQKSHSAWSNTKLTSLCICTIIIVSIFWLSLVYLEGVLSIIVPIASGALTILCLLGFSKFTR